ncbi:hypothetical protein J6590_101082 [Homalodisca vitripennis]|nr:hypothetical protein J6590_101082 [Homalodisca vitripennis]
MRLCRKGKPALCSLSKLYHTLLGIQAPDNPESPPLHNTDAGSIHDIDCLLNFRNFKGPNGLCATYINRFTRFKSLIVSKNHMKVKLRLAQYKTKESLPPKRYYVAKHNSWGSSVWIIVVIKSTWWTFLEGPVCLPNHIIPQPCEKLSEDNKLCLARTAPLIQLKGTRCLPADTSFTTD